MKTYAYVENGVVQETYGILPKNWKNYSNFYALDGDIEFLNSIGWYEIQTEYPSYDLKTQTLGSFTYELKGNIVIESREIVELEIPLEDPVIEDQEEIVEEEEVVEKTPEQLLIEEEERLRSFLPEADYAVIEEWKNVRLKRNELIKDVDWKILRHQRELRMNLSPTDSLENLDKYAQALADITLQTEDPFSIIWPTLET